MLSKLIPNQKIRSYSLASLFTAVTILMVSKNIPDTVLKKNDIIYWQPITPNITCYYYNEGDALPSAEAAGFAPAPRSIFFHETSCRGGLNSRQACAVESAARAHPHRQVHVLFNSPISAYVLNKSCISKLLRLQNVKLTRVHVKEYTKDTKLIPIFAKMLRLSKFPIEHAADMLRIVTLNRWGGVYMDLDMLVLRSLDSLPVNFVVRQTLSDVGTGIMAFGKDETGSYFTNELIKNISETFDPSAWDYNGPDALSRLIQQKCQGFLNSNSNECQGLNVYPSKLFYPVDFPNRRYYYEAKYRSLEEVINISLKYKSYTHHMWNHNERNKKIEKQSLYARLANKYCPTIYNAYGDEFGA